MLNTKAGCLAGILVLSAMLAVAPAMAADASGMAARIVSWEKAYNADDLKSIAAMYAADGCRMPPNAKTAQGTDAILAQLKAGKDNGAAKVKLGLASAQTNGDLGSARGTYEVMSADGKQIEAGKWMNMSKRSNRKWMIQCDIWNSDNPPPAAKAK